MLRSFVTRSWQCTVAVFFFGLLAGCKCGADKPATFLHDVIPKGMVVGWSSDQAPVGFNMASAFGNCRYKHLPSSTGVRHVVIPDDAVLGSTDAAPQQRVDYDQYAGDPADWIKRTASTSGNVHKGVVLGWPRTRAEEQALGKDAPTGYVWCTKPDYWIVAESTPPDMAPMHTVIPEGLAIGWADGEPPDGFSPAKSVDGPYYQHAGGGPTPHPVSGRKKWHDVIPVSAIFESAQTLSSVPKDFATYGGEPQDWIRRIGNTAGNVPKGGIFGWPTKRALNQDPPGDAGEYVWHDGGKPTTWIVAGPWP